MPQIKPYTIAKIIRTNNLAVLSGVHEIGKTEKILEGNMEVVYLEVVEAINAKEAERKYLEKIKGAADIERKRKNGRRN